MEREDQVYMNNGMVYLKEDVLMDEAKLYFQGHNNALIIAGYYYRDRFFHVEVYDLCVLSHMFPDFMKCPQNKGFFLEYADLRHEPKLKFLLKRFENYFFLKRKIICKKAAEELGVKWSEVEAVAKSRFWLN